MRSITWPRAIVVALGILLISAGIGELLDVVFGTQGWWLALGALGLCGAALWLGVVATRDPLT